MKRFGGRPSGVDEKNEVSGGGEGWGAPERRVGDAVPRQVFAPLLAFAKVALVPRAAVQVDDQRKRPRAARPVHSREQRLPAVADVFDVGDIDLVL